MYRTSRSVQVGCVLLLNRPSTAQKFDHTGLFAAFCRHHHFVIGANMDSGEKYAFAFLLLVRVGLFYPAMRVLNVMYDIGPCQWGPWCMKVIAILHLVPELLGLVPVLKPIQFIMAPFHKNDHKPQCQVEHDAFLVPRAGLTHGEHCEQAWSVSNPQADVLKGMGIARRHCMLALYWVFYNNGQRVCAPPATATERRSLAATTCVLLRLAVIFSFFRPSFVACARVHLMALKH